MNPFTAHPQEQGINYREHCYFALGIAGRLMTSVIAFTLHALLPFIPIAPRHDLEATTAFLLERNEWIETSHQTALAHDQQNLNAIESHSMQHHIAVSH
jgi:hypothetical protein